MHSSSDMCLVGLYILAIINNAERIFTFKFLCGDMLSFIMSISLRVGLLGHIVLAV